MKAQLLIVQRFLRPKGRSSSLTSLITLLSIIGVALGVMVPIIVLSVMSGFQDEIKTKILSLKGHITMTTVLGTSMRDYENIIDFMNAQPDVIAAVPYIEVQGLIHFHDRFEPVLIRGIEQSVFTTDTNFSQLLEMTQGTQDLSRKYYIMIGSELAAHNYIAAEDRLTLILADQHTLTIDTRTQTVKGVIKGIFKTGFQDFDRSVVYISLRTLQDILDENGRVNAIDLKLSDVFNTENIVQTLVAQYGDRYQIFTWKELNRNLFKALALEQTVMYLIMLFILLVAIFNVTSAQLILIIERKKEIGILKTIGMTPFNITQIFLMEGLVVTLLGAVTGGILGYLISLDVGLFIGILESIVNFFGKAYFMLGGLIGFTQGNYESFSIFPKGIYYLDAIPSSPNITRVWVFILVALGLSLISGLFPSLKAASMRPVDVMRYE